MKNNTDIKPGDVREINGVTALVMKIVDDNTYRCCPVKPRSGDDDSKVSGKVVFVENGMALPEFAAGIYKDFVGKLLFRVSMQQVDRANLGFVSIFRDVPDGTFDIANPNSQEDWHMYKRMSGSSFERFLSFEADTFVFDENGQNPRPETKKERRNRLARRRRFMKKAENANS